jgi:hypothetical protein
MSRRGSDNRQRELTLSARFNEREAEAIRQMPDHAGSSVAAVIPGAVLNAPISRAARRPRVNHEMVARVLGELGRIADILRAAAMAIGPIRRTRMLPPRSATSPRRARSLSGHGARAMILKGNQRAGGNDLATHLMNEFDNEHRGKMYSCNLYLGDGRRRLGIGGSMYEPRTHTNKESRAPDTAELRGHNVQ